AASSFTTPSNSSTLLKFNLSLILLAIVQHLLSQFFISISDLTVYTVPIDANSFRTGFCSFYRYRNYTFKDWNVGSIGFSNFGRNILCIIGSVICHGKKDSFNNQSSVQSPLYHGDSFDQLLKTLDRQVCSLDRN